MKQNNPDNEIPTIIEQPESHTPEEMFGNWEVALKRNSRGITRGKKFMWVLAFSFLIDILLTTGFFYNTIQNHEETQRAAVATCVSGNKARDDNRHLWDYVLNLVDKDGKPSQAIVKFEKYLDEATTPRNCESK